MRLLCCAYLQLRRLKALGHTVQRWGRGDAVATCFQSAYSSVLANALPVPCASLFSSLVGPLIHVSDSTSSLNAQYDAIAEK